MSTKPKPWSRSDIPDLSGKVCIVTGSTTGIGYETAVGLVQGGASEVILVGRTVERGDAAVQRLKSTFPETKTIISFSPLDLGSLESVTDFARKFNERKIALDILVNNAGIKAPLTRQTTKDGFEITFGTNHLAPFALTAQLFPSLMKCKAPRIVNVSSGLASRGEIDFNDLQCEKKSYSTFKLYAQSKLCNLLFTQELQRKSDAKAWRFVVLAVDPGLVKTDIHTVGPVNDTFLSKLVSVTVLPLFGQEPKEGASSSLYAATSPKIMGGEYCAPSGFLGLFGTVGKQHFPNNANDVEVAKKLWQVSEELTHVNWTM